VFRESQVYPDGQVAPAAEEPQVYELTHWPDRQKEPAAQSALLEQVVVTGTQVFRVVSHVMPVPQSALLEHTPVSTQVALEVSQ
jgi:hypothetical protein